MFDHIGFGVSDIDLSREFFLKALAPLGVSLAMQGPASIGLGRQGKPSLWLYPQARVAGPLHIAIAADTHAQVDAFHAAALAAGGKDNGPPGLRPHYHPHYYAAFVIGPMATTWKRCAIGRRHEAGRSPGRRTPLSRGVRPHRRHDESRQPRSQGLSRGGRFSMSQSMNTRRRCVTWRLCG